MKCEVCNDHGYNGAGCVSSAVQCDGVVLERIKVGETDDFSPLSAGEHCPECHASADSYHHWGCDIERCPSCGLQLLACDCENVYALVEEKEKNNE